MKKKINKTSFLLQSCKTIFSIFSLNKIYMLGLTIIIWNFIVNNSLNSWGNKFLFSYFYFFKIVLFINAKIIHILKICKFFISFIRTFLISRIFISITFIIQLKYGKRKRCGMAN